MYPRRIIFSTSFLGFFVISDLLQGSVDFRKRLRETHRTRDWMIPDAKKMNLYSSRKWCYCAHIRQNFGSSLCFFLPQIQRLILPMCQHCDFFFIKFWFSPNKIKQVSKKISWKLYVNKKSFEKQNSLYSVDPSHQSPLYQNVGFQLSIIRHFHPGQIIFQFLTIICSVTAHDSYN